jgi:plastocyanin
MQSVWLAATLSVVGLSGCLGADDGADDVTTESTTTGGAPAASGTSPSGAPATPAGPRDFVVQAVLDAPTSLLADTRAVTLTITPSGGFSGDITLTTTGTVPTGWSVQVPATGVVNVPGAAAVTVNVPIVVASRSLTGMQTVTLRAVAGSITHDQAISLMVKPEINIRIPANVALTNNPTAFGPPPTQLPFVAPGTKVNFVNDDAIAHRIHASNAGQGFAHQANNLLPGGAPYSVTINSAGTYNFRCHIHEGMTGQLVVAEVR